MKSFKQFLLKESETSIISAIQPYLSSVTDDRYLVRGISRSSTAIKQDPVLEVDTGIMGMSGENLKIKVFRGKVRKDRRPLSASEEQQEAMDKWFKAKFGYKVRSESLFTLRQGAPNKINNVGTYGVPSYVAPIGSFDYIYSRESDDLFFDVQYYNTTTDEEVAKQLDALDVVKNEGWDEIPDGHEVMVQCDEYFIFMLFDGNYPCRPDAPEEANAIHKTFRKIIGV